MRPIVALLLLSLVSMPVAAGFGRSPLEREMRPPTRMAAQGQLSLDEAVSLARMRVGGRVLAAEKVRRDGMLMYRIKLLTERGVVRVVYVDAVSGELR